LSHASDTRRATDVTVATIDVVADHDATATATIRRVDNRAAVAVIDPVAATALAAEPVLEVATPPEITASTSRTDVATRDTDADAPITTAIVIAVAVPVDTAIAA
jgi:hypothetical protein